MDSDKFICKKCAKEISHEDVKNNEGLCQNCYDSKDKKENIILFSVLLVICLIAIVVFGVQNYMAESKYEEQFRIDEEQFKTDIEERITQNYQNISNITIDGTYNKIVNVNITDVFKEYSYEEQETVVSGINAEINEEFEKYVQRRKENKSTKDINEKLILESVNICVSGDFYSYDDSKKTILKNGEVYKSSDYLVEQKEILRNKILSKIQDDSFKEYLNSITDIEDLKNIILIEDISECKKEVIYLSAINLYNDNQFNKAIDRMNLIEGNYKEKQQYIDNSILYNELQGTYQQIVILDGKEYNGYKWIIRGKMVYRIYDTLTESNAREIYYFVIENNKYYISVIQKDSQYYHYYEVEWDGNKLTEVNSKYETQYVWKKESDSTELPEKKYIKEPQIGMTKEEVEASTWGKPIRINRTTTIYGIREQWVYSGNRYLYFDNGYLTSIQD